MEGVSGMREDSFTKKIFYRFFFPAVAASICLGLANLADALCVGMVMGESALAAISLVTPIYMVFNVLHLGMAVGGSVTFAQLMGGGKVKQAVNVFRQMLLLALMVSVVLAVLGEVFVEPLILLLGADPSQGEVYEMTKSYAVRLLAAAPLFFLNMLFYYFLRCDDGERRASVGLAVSNLLDVGLSFVFVLVFKMGINGAVYSTIVGVGAAVLIYLPHFFKKANILSLRLAKPDFKVMAQCYRTGFSSSSQYIWQFLFFLVINNLLIARHGESGLAVFNVVLNISYLAVGLFDGVAATIQPLAATFHGERNRQAERDTLRLALKWGGVLGVLLLGAIVIFAPQVARIFGLSEDMAGMGAPPAGLEVSEAETEEYLLLRDLFFRGPGYVAWDTAATAYALEEQRRCGGFAHILNWRGERYLLFGAKQGQTLRLRETTLTLEQAEEAAPWLCACYGASELEVECPADSPETGSARGCCWNFILDVPGWLGFDLA